MSSNRVISLDRLKQGDKGVSPAVGAAYAEAGLICLTDHNHQPNVEIDILGTQTDVLNLHWSDAMTPQIENSWRDLPAATEYAACGIAFLLVEALLKYEVVYQARRGTGVDYWLRSINTDTNETVQQEARLEVSGILSSAKTSMVKARVREKLMQTSDEAIDTYVVVVEFSRPLGWMEKKS